MKAKCVNLTANPHSCLSDYIECYSYRKISVEKGDKLVKTMPHRISTSLDFYLGARHKTIQTTTLQEAAYYRCGVRGYRTFSKYTIEIEDLFRSFTVKFKPGGFYALFGIPLSEFTNQDLPLEELGILPAKEILERLCRLDNVAEMKAVLEEYLLRIISNRKIREFTLHFPDYLTNVDELASCYGKSIRQLERMYNYYIGLGPKAFHNLHRFQYLLHLRKQYPYENWTMLGYRADYFDQSHLIKDFKSYLNITPSHFDPSLFAF